LRLIGSSPCARALETEQRNPLLEIFQGFNVLHCVRKVDVAGAGATEPQMDRVRQTAAQGADRTRCLGGRDRYEAEGQRGSARPLDRAQQVLDRELDAEVDRIGAGG
jgi:hypothetical protein